jgi:ABC-type proline/glycine betaine transport system permease subunit
MARSTAPVLAMAGIALFNDIVIKNSTFTDEFRVVAAAGFGTLIFAGLEKVNAQFAVGIAYIGLVTAIVAPLAKDKTSFAQRAYTWFNQSGVGS